MKPIMFACAIMMAFAVALPSDARRRHHYGPPYYPQVQTEDTLFKICNSDCRTKAAEDEARRKRIEDQNLTVRDLGGEAPPLTWGKDLDDFTPAIEAPLGPWEIAIRLIGLGIVVLFVSSLLVSFVRFIREV